MVVFLGCVACGGGISQGEFDASRPEHQPVTGPTVTTAPTPAPPARLGLMATAAAQVDDGPAPSDVVDERAYCQWLAQIPALSQTEADAWNTLECATVLAEPVAPDGAAQ